MKDCCICKDKINGSPYLLYYTGSVKPFCEHCLIRHLNSNDNKGTQIKRERERKDRRVLEC